MAELRAYCYLDRLQPQFASLFASACRGFLSALSKLDENPFGQLHTAPTRTSAEALLRDFPQDAVPYKVGAD